MLEFRPNIPENLVIYACYSQFQLIEEGHEVMGFHEFVIEIDPDVTGTKRPLAYLLAELWATFPGDLMHLLGTKSLQRLTGLLACAGAMADPILSLRGKLRHGLT